MNLPFFKKRVKKIEENSINTIVNDIYFYEDFTLSEVNESYVGRKGLSLFELYDIDIPIPPFFSISPEVYTSLLFKAFNKKISQILDGSMSIDAKQYSQMISKARFENYIQEQLLKAYSRLSGFSDAWVSVRSSVVFPSRPDVSFSGVFGTELNVKGFDNLLEAIKLIYQSVFTDKVIAYAKAHSLPLSELKMSVVVQKMIQSEVSGVAYTRDPITNLKDRVTVEAVFGLGDVISNGELTPDQYILNKKDLAIIEKHIAPQDWMKIRRVSPKRENGHFGTEEKIQISKSWNHQQKLEDRFIEDIAKVAMIIEDRLKSPHLVEWVWESGNVWVLQTKPLEMIDKNLLEKEEVKTEGFNSLAAEIIKQEHEKNIIAGAQSQIAQLNTVKEEVSKDNLVSSTEITDQTRGVDTIMTGSDESSIDMPTSVKDIMALTDSQSDAEVAKIVNQQAMTDSFGADTAKEQSNSGKDLEKSSSGKGLAGIFSPRSKNTNAIKGSMAKKLDSNVDYFAQLEKMINEIKDKESASLQGISPVEAKSDSASDTNNFAENQRSAEDIKSEMSTQNVSDKDYVETTNTDLKQSSDEQNIASLDSDSAISNEVADAQDIISKASERISKSFSNVGTLIGSAVGASYGVVSGQVKVATSSPNDIGQVNRSMILVIPIYSVGYQPVILSSGGVIVGDGGMASDVAIICREQGIPCVVGANKFIHQLENGDEIRIDGSLGGVYLLSKYSEQALYQSEAPLSEELNEKHLDEASEKPDTVSKSQIFNVNHMNQDSKQEDNTITSNIHTATRIYKSGTNYIDVDKLFIEYGVHPASMDAESAKIFTQNICQTIDKIADSVGGETVFATLGLHSYNKFKALKGGKDIAGEGQGLKHYLSSPQLTKRALSIIRKVRNVYKDRNVVLSIANPVNPKFVELFKQEVLSAGLRRSGSFEIHAVLRRSSEIILSQSIFEAGIDGIIIDMSALDKEVMDDESVLNLFDNIIRQLKGSRAKIVAIVGDNEKYLRYAVSKGVYGVVVKNTNEQTIKIVADEEAKLILNIH